ncbi:hypothetical protein GTA08_BOTSDO01536 [Botryosphaeria dothidea]|uniref:Uncharacterized protein n=1 Tax=Botryosphaeria dothidea TaxID=55169 RepID=A0A8H4J4P3_9PEZI|nr:hypothetical protein GTA08_BOTSDO01536 [Botryosphaeria dothidea]
MNISLLVKEREFESGTHGLGEASQTFPYPLSDGKISSKNSDHSYGDAGSQLHNDTSNDLEREGLELGEEIMQAQVPEEQFPYEEDPWNNPYQTKAGQNQKQIKALLEDPGVFIASLSYEGFPFHPDYYEELRKGHPSWIKDMDMFHVTYMEFNPKWDSLDALTPTVEYGSKAGDQATNEADDQTTGRTAFECIPIECRPAVFHVDGLREEYSQDMVEKKRQEEPKFAEKSRKRLLTLINLVAFAVIKRRLRQEDTPSISTGAVFVPNSVNAHDLVIL